jgi:hypothetical protein
MGKKKKQYNRDRVFVISDLEVLQEDLSDTTILNEMVRALPTDKLNEIVNYIAQTHEINLTDY